jgi:hypothetical protein
MARAGLLAVGASLRAGPRPYLARGPLDHGVRIPAVARCHLQRRRDLRGARPG